MTFKSSTQPLCRCCGKPIAKATTTIEFVREMNEYQRNGSHPWCQYIVTEGPVTTKEGAQKHTNQKVISVKRGYDPSEVRSVGIWDGESYRDEFFCNRTQCAVRYAYMVVEKSGLVSAAYNNAIKRRSA